MTMARKRKIWKDVKIFSDLVAVILIWRGVWSLFDAYFFPENPILSNIIGVAIGLILLLVDDFALKELEKQE